MVAERGGGLVWAVVVTAWLKLGSWFFEGGGSDDELRRGGRQGMTGSGLVARRR
jgi:hypothetical protein